MEDQSVQQHVQVPSKVVVLWCPREFETYRWSHAAALHHFRNVLPQLGDVVEESDWNFGFVCWKISLDDGPDPDPDAVTRNNPRCVTEMLLEGDAVSKQPRGEFSIIHDNEIDPNLEGLNKRVICLNEDTNTLLSSAPTTMILRFSGTQYRVGKFRVRTAEFQVIDFPKLRGSMIEMECLIPDLPPGDAASLDIGTLWPLLEMVDQQVIHGHFLAMTPDFNAYRNLPNNGHTLYHTAVVYDHMLATFVRLLPPGAWLPAQTDDHNEAAS